MLIKKNYRFAPKEVWIIERKLASLRKIFVQFSYSVLIKEILKMSFKMHTQSKWLKQTGSNRLKFFSSRESIPPPFLYCVSKNIVYVKIPL
jgi:hypothetical protein